MPTPTEIAPPTEESERAPRSASHGGVVASPRRCQICGTPLRGRQEACSAKCRAAKSRRNRILVKAGEFRGLRVLVRETVGRMSEIQRDTGAMLERLWEAKTALDRYLGE